MIFDKRKIKSFWKFTKAQRSVFRLNKESRLVCLSINLKNYKNYMKKMQLFCLFFEIFIEFFPLLFSLTNPVVKLSFVSMSQKYTDSLSVCLCIHDSIFSTLKTKQKDIYQIWPKLIMKRHNKLKDLHNENVEFELIVQHLKIAETGLAHTRGKILQDTKVTRSFIFIYRLHVVVSKV